MADSFTGGAIASALAERWAEYLEAGERFEAEVALEGASAVATLALVGAEGAERSEFEVRAPIGTAGRDRAGELALDAADAVLGEWLEDGRPRLAGLREARDYAGTPVVVTSRYVRPRLQAEADRLLGERDDGGLDD